MLLLAMGRERSGLVLVWMVSEIVRSCRVVFAEPVLGTVSVWGMPL